MESPQLKFIAKQLETMPKFIKDTIREYTTTVRVNRILRGGFVPKENRKKGFQKMVRYLDLAFSLVEPLKSDITVYRGIHNVEKFFESDKGYVSTATMLTADVLQTFSGSSCCLLVIRVPKGSRVLRIPHSIGSYGDENEVLLFRGGKFVLSKIQEPDLAGKKTYTLDYIEAPITPKPDPELKRQVREYMELNSHVIKFLSIPFANLMNSVREFNTFLTEKNYIAVFRCILGDARIWGVTKILFFVYIIFERFPNIITRITGLPSSDSVPGDIRRLIGALDPSEPLSEYSNLSELYILILIFGYVDCRLLMEHVRKYNIVWSWSTILEKLIDPNLINRISALEERPPAPTQEDLFVAKTWPVLKAMLELYPDIIPLYINKQIIRPQNSYEAFAVLYSKNPRLVMPFTDYLVLKQDTPSWQDYMLIDTLPEDAKADVKANTLNPDIRNHISEGEENELPEYDPSVFSRPTPPPTPPEEEDDEEEDDEEEDDEFEDD